MHKEQSGFGDNAVATLQANASIPEGMGIEGHYHVECRDAQGNLKWIKNPLGKTSTYCW